MFWNRILFVSLILGNLLGYAQEASKPTRKVEARLAINGVTGIVLSNKGDSPALSSIGLGGGAELMFKPSRNLFFGLLGNVNGAFDLSSSVVSPIIQYDAALFVRRGLSDNIWGSGILGVANYGVRITQPMVGVRLERIIMKHLTSEKKFQFWSFAAYYQPTLFTLGDPEPDFLLLKLGRVWTL